MIGFYGDIIFETSDDRILTFVDMTRNTGSRWANHEVIGRKPATEFLGAGLDTLSFTIHMSGQHGTRPREEMDLWLRKARSGEANTMVVGTRRLGVDKWIVKSVSTVWNAVMNRGEVLSGNVDIELEEYVEEVN